MKVYFVAFNLMNNSTSDYFISLCNLISKEAKVIIFASKIRETNIALNSNIIVLKLPSIRPTKIRDFIFFYRKVKQYKPDVMISMFGFVNLFLIIGRFCNVKFRIAWIRSLDSPKQPKDFKVIRKRLVYRLATHILTNSQSTKLYAKRFFRINESKITVLPNSVVDYSHLYKHIIPNKTKIIYVGRLHPGKGLETLIESMEILKKKGFFVNLDIIGTGILERKFREMVNDKNLNHVVNFLGGKKKEEVLLAFKNSYIAIVPSEFEAFGFTVIEAMSVGTCVIGANNTGIKEIIKHQKTGLLFKTGDASDLTENIITLLDDNDYRNRLAYSGYKNFKNRYDINMAIKRDLLYLNKL